MACRLFNMSDKDTVSAGGLQCGELAVVVSWPNESVEPGAIVQRYKDDLIVVGASVRKCFPGTCAGPAIIGRLRRLQPGETIIIESVDL